MDTYQGGSNWAGTAWPANNTVTSKTVWHYDPVTGLLWYKVDPAGQGVVYRYDACGRVIYRSWARRKAAGSSDALETYYAYDANTGELTGVSYNDGTLPVGYTYNRAGLLATVTDATGTRTFGYDATDPLQRDTETLDSTFYGGRVLTQLYDTTTGVAGSPDYGPYKAGFVTGRPDGFELGTAASPSADLYQQYTYSELGLPVGVGTVTGTAGREDFLYTYQPDSDLVSGYACGSNWSVKRSYESTRDLLTEQQSQWAGATVAEFDYQNDAGGRRSSVVRQGSAFTNEPGGSVGLTTYDGLGELTAWAGYSGTDPQHLGSSLSNRQFSYGYDVSGNRTSSSGPAGTTGYSADVCNRYSALSGTGAESLAYDADGNLTSDGQWAYVYDGENRLVQMTNAGTGTVLAFKYDYRGRRAEKTVTVNGTVQSDRRYVYAGNRLVAEWAQSGGVWNVARSYVWGLDVNGGRAPPSGWNSTQARSYVWGLDVNGAYRGSGGVGALLEVDNWSGGTVTAYDAASDGNGNVCALIRASDGLVAAAYDYSPFGETLWSGFGDPAVQDNPMGFSSKCTDLETGLVYYGNRYYSPALGRFLNQDPIQEAGGLNLYGFCGNDPVDHWDYLGFEPGQDDPDLLPAYYVYASRINLGLSGFGGSGLSGASIATVPFMRVFGTPVHLNLSAIWFPQQQDSSDQTKQKCKLCRELAKEMADLSEQFGELTIPQQPQNPMSGSELWAEIRSRMASQAIGIMDAAISATPGASFGLKMAGFAASTAETGQAASSDKGWFSASVSGALYGTSASGFINDARVAAGGESVLTGAGATVTKEAGYVGTAFVLYDILGDPYVAYAERNSASSTDPHVIQDEWENNYKPRITALAQAYQELNCATLLGYAS